ncbi:hypothetical protein AQUCO_01300408v1 [Aquilegia coerulea]|uniref:EF-hand domain-containing protein n=1 Tax=Aquilegia coerulea TaxID=218851 RepID=A0A2G5E1E2_AQUCA|nr:hypothetical protein AQUCO_01300408v1 [Aquilegia coerulea]
MDEIREVALAYYANSSDDTKEVAKNFFNSMDIDGDGKISMNEFEEYVKKKWRRFKPELFAELDKDGDGFLDFEEVIVFYYMAKMRNSFCDGCCGEYLKNLYFTCVHCFQKKSSNQTYDLCLTCYQTKQFTHEHKVFLDNYAMLNFIWSDSKKKVDPNEAIKTMGEGFVVVGDVIQLVSAGQACRIL